MICISKDGRKGVFSKEKGGCSCSFIFQKQLKSCKVKRLCKKSSSQAHLKFQIASDSLLEIQTLPAEWLCLCLFTSLTSALSP